MYNCWHRRCSVVARVQSSITAPATKCTECKWQLVFRERLTFNVVIHTHTHGHFRRAQKCSNYLCQPKPKMPPNTGTAAQRNFSNVDVSQLKWTHQEG